MRIVLINWAPIRDGASRGGGVNGYAQALAAELVRNGHDVISLCGGMRFEAAGGCRIERIGDWEGVAAYEVVNSPVLAPSLAQFREPLGEVSAPELEREVGALMARLRPDIVHWHNIEGFSAGCIPATRGAAPNARILFSLHNYHTICPQVYLMQGHRRPCRSFDHGHACVNCVQAVEPAAERQRLMASAPFVRPTPAPVAEKPAAPAPAPKHVQRRRPESMPWPPRFVPGRGPHPYYCEDVPGWRPLLNVIEPDAPSGKAPNDYANRRAAMVQMLNACDRVLAVSAFVQRKFQSMGVRPTVMRTCRIGSRMTEIASAFRAERPAELPPLVDARGTLARPIRLAFMGYNNWYKGLPMLADSLDLLTPEVTSRFHLHVYALEGQQMEPQFRLLEPRLGGLTLRHGYRYEDIPRLLDGIDLGIVPSVWWDNGPQTVMEFFACGVPVLGAELGGIPDLVHEGINGLLYRGNDRWELARRLAGIAKNPVVLPALAANVRPPRSMADHAAELEQIYAERLS